MKRTPGSRRRSGLILAAALLAFMGFIIYRSLRIGSYTCSVCIDFRGQSVCRQVDGSTELDARRAATTNACAYLASGVTDSLACERTEPRSVACSALN